MASDNNRVFTTPKKIPENPSDFTITGILDSKNNITITNINLNGNDFNNKLFEPGLTPTIKVKELKEYIKNEFTKNVINNQNNKKINGDNKVEDDESFDEIEVTGGNSKKQTRKYYPTRKNHKRITYKRKTIRRRYV